MTTKHISTQKLWFKAVAMGLIVACLVNQVSYAMEPSTFRKNVSTLSPASRFVYGDNFIIDSDNARISELAESLKEDASLLYVSRLIGQVLDSTGTLISEKGLRTLIGRHVADIEGNSSFILEDLYKEGKTYCLPYIRKEDGLRKVLRFYLPKDNPKEANGKPSISAGIGEVRIVQEAAAQEDPNSYGEEFQKLLDSLNAHEKEGTFARAETGEDAEPLKDSPIHFLLQAIRTYHGDVPVNDLFLLDFSILPKHKEIESKTKAKISKVLEPIYNSLSETISARSFPEDLKTVSEQEAIVAIETVLALRDDHIEAVDRSIEEVLEIAPDLEVVHDLLRYYKSRVVEFFDELKRRYEDFKETKKRLRTSHGKEMAAVEALKNSNDEFDIASALNKLSRPYKNKLEKMAEEKQLKGHSQSQSLPIVVLSRDILLEIRNKGGLEGKRILEVGPSYGVFMYALKELSRLGDIDLDIVGIEADAQRAEYARTLGGLNVITGDITSPPEELQKEQFDYVVVSWPYFEIYELRQIEDFLIGCYKMTAPGGRCVIVTNYDKNGPDFNAIPALCRRIGFETEYRTDFNNSLFLSLKRPEEKDLRNISKLTKTLPKPSILPAAKKLEPKEAKRAKEKLSKFIDAIKRGKYQKGNKVDLRGLARDKEVIIVGDLHERLDNFGAILEHRQITVASSGKKLSASVEDKIHSGEAVLIILGDAVHSDSAKTIERATSMDKSLEIMEWIMDLKIQSPDNVYYLLGNHDDPDAECGKSYVENQGMENEKVIQVNQSQAFREKLTKEFGPGYLKLYRKFVDVSPIRLLADGLIATHAGPSKGLSLKNIKALRKKDIQQDLSEERYQSSALLWGRHERILKRKSLSPEVIEDVRKSTYSLEDIERYRQEVRQPGAIFIVAHTPVLIPSGSFYAELEKKHFVVYGASNDTGYVSYKGGSLEFFNTKRETPESMIKEVGIIEFFMEKSGLNFLQEFNSSNIKQHVDLLTLKNTIFNVTVEGDKIIIGYMIGNLDDKSVNHDNIEIPSKKYPYTLRGWTEESGELSVVLNESALNLLEEPGERIKFYAEYVKFARYLIGKDTSSDVRLSDATQQHFSKILDEGTDRKIPATLGGLASLPIIGDEQGPETSSEDTSSRSGFSRIKILLIAFSVIGALAAVMPMMNSAFEAAQIALSAMPASSLKIILAASLVQVGMTLLGGSNKDGFDEKEMRRIIKQLRQGNLYMRMAAARDLKKMPVPDTEKYYFLLEAIEYNLDQIMSDAREDEMVREAALIYLGKMNSTFPLCANTITSLVNMMSREEIGLRLQKAVLKVLSTLRYLPQDLLRYAYRTIIGNLYVKVVEQLHEMQEYVTYGQIDPELESLSIKALGSLLGRPQNNEYYARETVQEIERKLEHFAEIGTMGLLVPRLDRYRYFVVPLGERARVTAIYESGKMFIQALVDLGFAILRDSDPDSNAFIEELWEQTDASFEKSYLLFSEILNNWQDNSARVTKEASRCLTIITKQWDEFLLNYDKHPAFGQMAWMSRNKLRNLLIMKTYKPFYEFGRVTFKGNKEVNLNLAAILSRVSLPESPGPMYIAEAVIPLAFDVNEKVVRQANAILTMIRNKDPLMRKDQKIERIMRLSNPSSSTEGKEGSTFLGVLLAVVSISLISTAIFLASQATPSPDLISGMFTLIASSAMLLGVSTQTDEPFPGPDEGAEDGAGKWEVARSVTDYSSILYKAWNENVLERALMRAKVYVDAGCGVGRAAVEAAVISENLQGDLRTYGVDAFSWEEKDVKKSAPTNKGDFSWEEFKKEKDRLEKAGRYSFIKGDITDVNLPEKADVITSLFVLQYVKDPLKALTNLYNQLNKDGALIIMFVAPKGSDAPEAYSEFLKGLSRKYHALPTELTPIYIDSEDAEGFSAIIRKTNDEEASLDFVLSGSKKSKVTIAGESFDVAAPTYYGIEGGRVGSERSLKAMVSSEKLAKMRTMQIWVDAETDKVSVRISPRFIRDLSTIAERNEELATSIAYSIWLHEFNHTFRGEDDSIYINQDEIQANYLRGRTYRHKNIAAVFWYWFLYATDEYRFEMIDVHSTEMFLEFVARGNNGFEFLLNDEEAKHEIAKFIMQYKRDGPKKSGYNTSPGARSSDISRTKGWEVLSTSFSKVIELDKIDVNIEEVNTTFIVDEDFLDAEGASNEGSLAAPEENNGDLNLPSELRKVSESELVKWNASFVQKEAILTGELAELIALYADLPPPEQEFLRKAGYAHDIGKKWFKWYFDSSWKAPRWIRTMFSLLHPELTIIILQLKGVNLLPWEKEVLRHHSYIHPKNTQNSSIARRCNTILVIAEQLIARYIPRRYKKDPLKKYEHDLTIKWIEMFFVPSGGIEGEGRGVLPPEDMDLIDVLERMEEKEEFRSLMERALKDVPEGEIQNDSEVSPEANSHSDNLIAQKTILFTDLKDNYDETVAEAIKHINAQTIFYDDKNKKHSFSAADGEILKTWEEGDGEIVIVKDMRWGQIVAYALMGPTMENYVLDSIAVDPEYIDKDIGTALVLQALLKAKEQGYKHLFIGCLKDKLTFYKKFNNLLKKRVGRGIVTEIGTEKPFPDVTQTGLSYDLSKIDEDKLRAVYKEIRAAAKEKVYADIKKGSSAWEDLLGASTSGGRLNVKITGIELSSRSGIPIGFTVSYKNLEGFVRKQDSKVNFNAGLKELNAFVGRELNLRVISLGNPSRGIYPRFSMLSGEVSEKPKDQVKETESEKKAKGKSRQTPKKQRKRSKINRMSKQGLEQQLAEEDIKKAVDNALDNEDIYNLDESIERDVNRRIVSVRGELGNLWETYYYGPEVTTVMLRNIKTGTMNIYVTFLSGKKGEQKYRIDVDQKEKGSVVYDFGNHRLGPILVELGAEGVEETVINWIIKRAKRENKILTVQDIGSPAISHTSGKSIKDPVYPVLNKNGEVERWNWDEQTIEIEEGEQQTSIWMEGDSPLAKKLDQVAEQLGLVREETEEGVQVTLAEDSVMTKVVKYMADSPNLKNKNSKKEKNPNLDWVRAEEYPWAEMVRSSNYQEKPVSQNQLNYQKNNISARKIFLEFLQNGQYGDFEVFKKTLSVMHKTLLLGENRSSMYVPHRVAEPPSEQVVFDYAGVFVAEEQHEDKLRKMHESIIKLIKADSGTTDIETLAEDLANIPFYGLTERYLFAFGNNSLYMNIVNGMLRLHGMNGIDHRNLDSTSNTKDIEALRRDMLEAVKQANPDPVRMVQKIAKKLQDVIEPDLYLTRSRLETLYSEGIEPEESKKAAGEIVAAIDRIIKNLRATTGSLEKEALYGSETFRQFAAALSHTLEDNIVNAIFPTRTYMSLLMGYGDETYLIKKASSMEEVHRAITVLQNISEIKEVRFVKEDFSVSIYVPGFDDPNKRPENFPYVIDSFSQEPRLVSGEEEKVSRLEKSGDKEAAVSLLEKLKDDDVDKGDSEHAQDFIDALINWIEARALDTGVRGEELIIGIGASWIPEVQRDLASMQNLLKKIEGLSKSRLKGFKNIKVIIEENPQVLANEIWNARKGKDPNAPLTLLSNIIILEEEDMLDSEVFEAFRGTDGEERSFFAKIKLPKDFYEDADTLDINIIKMVTEMLEKAATPGVMHEFYVELPDMVIYESLHDLAEVYAMREEAMIRA